MASVLGDAPALPPNGNPGGAMSQALIAVVDDDECMRDAIQSLVQSLGYHASTFASADEFLKFTQVHDTSCLISDVQMPGLSGLDLQDHLIARGHCIPIIFITGFPDDLVRARAMKAGAVGFFSKPFHQDQFIGCIDKALKAV
jgi:FixJ family two-component response regulator